MAVIKLIKPGRAHSPRLATTTLAIVLGLCLAATSELALAQAVPAPGTNPPSPGAPMTAPLSVPQLSQRASAPGGNFVVSTFTFAGNTVFSDAELAPVVQESLNRPLSFAELEGVATRVARFYRTKGYLVALAYLPPQSSSNGSVRINIVEGRYGAIQVKNDSRLNEQRIRATVAANICGRPDCTGVVVEQQVLEKAVLVLKDLPGVTAAAAIDAGRTEGTSDLSVTVKNTPALTGSVDADNHGGKYTGMERLGVGINWNNPSGRGDQVTASAAKTRDTTTGSLGYSVPVGYRGGRFGAGFTRSQFQLGAQFAATNTSGVSNAISVYGVYPLLRSVNSSLYTRLVLEHSDQNSTIAAATTTTIVDAARLSLTGDSADSVMGGGYTSYTLALSAGRVKPPVSDAATVNTEGGFTKISYGLVRQQSLVGGLTAYAAFNGQTGNKNLTGSEQGGLGGPFGVRAYPTGEAPGTTTQLLNLELRYTQSFSAFSAPATVTYSVFYDAGWAQAYKHLWPAATGANHRHIYGSGIGISLNTERFSLRATYAAHRSNRPSLSDPGSRERFWLQAGLRF